MQPFAMDLKSISLKSGGSPDITEISREDGFFLNTKRYNDFRIREEVYGRLLQARAYLPGGFHFMIYEAYRPKAFQEKLWHKTNQAMRLRYPDMPEAERLLLCETFTANPYDGIGSGHMAGCAIDVTLCSPDGHEVDMGTAMHEKSDLTLTQALGLSTEAQANRAMLRSALERAGFANYPAEWWHYSYGDHQWAWLTGHKEALFGPIDLPTKIAVF